MLLSYFHSKVQLSQPVKISLDEFTLKKIYQPNQNVRFLHLTLKKMKCNFKKKMCAFHFDNFFQKTKIDIIRSFCFSSKCILI